MKSAKLFTRNSNRNCSIVKSEKSLPTPILAIVLLLLISSQAYSAKESFMKELDLCSKYHNFFDMVTDSKNNIYLSANQCLIKSVDGGVNWKNIYFDKSEIFINAIESITVDKEDNLYIADNFGIYFLKAGTDTARYSRGFTYPKRIFATDDNLVVANSVYGSIIVSEDKSATWKEIFSTKEQFPYTPRGHTEYDKNFGIMNIVPEPYTHIASIFYTKNFGKIWYELGFPDDNQDLKDLYVIDEEFWFVNIYDGDTWQLCDLKENTAYTLKGFENYDLKFRFFQIDDMIYIYNGLQVYEFSKTTHTFQMISQNIFTEGMVNKIDAFAIDNNGVFYAARRYGDFKKSTDRGLTWQEIEVDVPIANLDKMKFKYSNGSLLTFDNRDFLYHSNDEGNNWTRIQMPKEPYYKSDFDMNKSNEIIVGTGSKILYTNDLGKNWKVLGAGSTKSYSSDNVRIHDDGSIISTGSSGGLYYFENNNDSARRIDLMFRNVTKLPDGRLLGIYNGVPAISNSAWDDFSTLKGFPKIDEYVISKSGEIYFSSLTGVYKCIAGGGKGESVGFYNIPVNNICEDDNGYLYVKVKKTNNIYCSKDNGVSWQSVTAKLPYFDINYPYPNNFTFCAFGNQNIIAKTDKLYIGQATNNKILQAEVSCENYILSYTDSTKMSIQIKDNYNSPVANTKAIIFYSIDNISDTVVTNSEGYADYYQKSDYYTPEAKYNFPIYMWAESDDAYSSPIILDSVMMGESSMPRQRIIHREGPYYYYADKNYQALYSMDMVDKYFINTPGKFLIENSLLGTKDLMAYDAGYPIHYEFQIPDTTKYGLYSIIFKGINAQNDTAYYETYIYCTDRKYMDWDTAAMDPPKYAVYPNPVKDFVTISNFWGKAQIFDIFGREVWSGLVEEKITINAASFSRGLYILKTINSQINQTKVTKIIKE